VNQAAGLRLPEAGPPRPAPLPEPAERAASARRALGRTALVEVLVFLGFLVLAAVESGLLSRLATRAFAGPDPIIDIWTLHWVATHLVKDPARLFEGNIFFPARDTVLFSDPLLGPALLVQPLLVFTSNPVLLYNAAVLLVLALTSHGLWRLTRALGADGLSALLPAIAVPYCAHQLHHLTHLNLLAICGLPWLLWALLGLLERPGRRTAAATAVAFAWQAGTGGYLAFTCAALSLTVAAWGFRALVRPRAILFASAAALLAGILLAPYIVGFLRVDATDRMERQVEDTVIHSLSIPEDLMRTPSYVWRGLLPAGGDSAFPGLTVLVLAGVAAARARGPHVRLLLLVAAVFLFLSLGPALVWRGRAVMPLPYGFLHQHVPLLRAGRHPSTFVIGTVLALGVLAGLGLAALRLPVLVRALALGLAALETLAPSPKRVDQGPLPEAYVWLAAHGAEAVAELPYDDDPRQLWAAYHGLCTTNGISPYAPAEHMELAQRITHEWKREPVGDLEGMTSLGIFLRRVPVTHLVLNPGRPPALARNVEATPATFTFLHETGDGARIYRVRRGGSGPLIRRAFREEQLRGATLAVRLRASGLPLQVRLNGREIARTTGEAAVVRVAVPDDLVGHDANQVEIAALDGTTAVELEDVAALASGPTGMCR
jgi:hypothetical protein